MKIVHTPSDVLHLTASKVDVIDKKIKELVVEMIHTLNHQKDPEGVGLAAPQVGVSKQIFIIKPESDSIPQTFINPKILKLEDIPQKSTGKKKKKGQRVQLEGCLSIPKIWGEVKRFDRVNIEWTDENNEKHTEWFEGFPATIIQHEMDHLHGLLFTRHVLEQSNSLYREEDGELVEFEI